MLYCDFKNGIFWIVIVKKDILKKLYIYCLRKFKLQISRGSDAGGVRYLISKPVIK